MSVVLLAAALSALPPRPEAPGREAWTFREELATHEDVPAWQPKGAPWLKDRISRCSFGPIKREPYNRDELMDDVDYYPDGYLEKLRRDGVNGLWITVEFHEIAETRFFPRDKNAERRLSKLRRTVEKCARYGIKVWIFALEPKWLKEDHPFRLANPALFVQRGDHFAMCPELPEVKDYLESAAFDVFSRVPGLGGFMGITHGEDVTSCFSYGGAACPRCEKLPRWQLHNDIVGALAKGVRRANPEARVISWFYQPEAQTTRPDWVYDCAAHLPEGVSLMYNFESGSLVKQQDRWRVGGDYWLSQPGPGLPFARFAEVARANGTALAAKIQMACSHEDATVPYIPVPGLLYRKFRAMRTCGVTSSLLSWYFGNFPCVMSKAAGRLAYEDFASGEDAFLLSLAAEDWGAQAPDVVRLWKGFAAAYRHYPLSNYMQYYGPYHAGVVWALRPQVEMRMLEPTWMPHYDPAGDAIGECLRDFSLDEALSLATAAAEMPEPRLVATNRAQQLDVGVMKAVRRQFVSARNIFDFYRTRSEAVYQSRILKRPAVARTQVRRLRELVAAERKLTQEMIPLCENDSRLGFHSEAEAHQFFPARLNWRLDALDRAEEDLEAVDRTLSSGGEYPESDWETQAERLYVGFDKWTEGADGFKFRTYRLDSGALQFEGEVPASLDGVTIATYDATAASFPLAYGLSRDGRLSAPVWNGEPRQAQPATLQTAAGADGGWSFKLIVPASVWGGDDRLRPSWAFCFAEGKRALWPAGKSGRWLGRLWHSLEPRQFGRLLYTPPPTDFCDKPYEPVARTTDTNNWYGARMKEKREAIATSGGAFDLVFIGDSITHFWEKCSWFATDGSEELAELKKRYSILDLGFAGDGTEHVLWRLQNGQADGYRAKCFMLLIGTNNKQGPVENVARGVGAILDVLREKHPEATVLLVSVFPRDVCPGDPLRVRMERLNALTETYVDGLKIRRIDLTDRFLTKDGFLDLSLFCKDRVHLNAKGYRLWRTAMEPFFDELAGDTRPYEFKDANRTEDEIAPWIDFESGPDWRAEPSDAATAAVASERMLFGRHTLAVKHTAAAEIRIRPACPLPLPKAHGWFAGWIRNDPSHRGKTAPDLHLVFRDEKGEESRLPLRNYYGKTKLNWPDWWYAVRRFSSDERKILDAPGTAFDGFVLTGCSNAVPATVCFDNLAFFDKDESRALKVPTVPSVAIPTRAEGALPDSRRQGARETVRHEGGATHFCYDGPDGRLEYVWTGSPDTLVASWNGGPSFRPAATGGARMNPEVAVYEARLEGKTLIVDVSAPAGEREVSLGHVEGASVRDRFLVPTLGDGYWWDENRSRVSRIDDGTTGLFVLAFPDWYVSAATSVVGRKQPDGTHDRVCLYAAKTDGSRNAVHERLYVTVSPDLMETLPVIANPPSPWKHVTGSKAWCRYSASPNRPEDRRFLARLHRYGIRDLVINEHECCMRDDGESFTFRDRSAPRKGGDAAWREYADYVINTLGYLYGPYNNFTDLAPVNANWSLDRVSRKSCEPDVPDAGGLMPAWTRCYAPKAAFAYASCARYAPLLKAKYGFNTAYCDVHTAILPWEYVDCDARVPDGGKFQPFYRAYAAILQEQKKAWNGPVYSEGTSHFFYAGLSDGNYGQLGVRTDKDPWIVDFDLRRIHPLECDFGVGNPGMFLPNLPTDSSSPELVGAIDRFLAATLAFGHAPFLVLDMMFTPRSDTGNAYPRVGRHATPEVGLPYVLRSYHMVLPAAKLYTQATAEEIRYLSDDGCWRDASSALLSGDRELQRIAVRYSDGTCVVANGHLKKRLKAVFAGRSLNLPPCAYCVWNERAGLEIESSDRFGSRVDYSASEEAIYLDTRQADADVILPKARGKGLAVCRREGKGWELIPVRGNVAFRIGGTVARALDVDRNDLGIVRLVRTDDGFISVEPRAGAFSYQILP